MNFGKIKRIFQLSHFNFSSNVNYPYLMGGLNYVPHRSKYCEDMILKTFKLKNLSVFQTAYRYTLKCIYEQDKASLLEIFEKNLTKRMQLNKVQLLNQETQFSQIYCSKLAFVIGTSFDRPSNLQIISQKKENEISFVLCQSSQMQKMLIVVQIVFYGQTKLMKINQPINNHKQYHKIQFEIEIKLSMQKLLKFFSKIKEVNQLQIINLMIENIFIGQDDYEWKIGDIDDLLKQNLSFYTK